MLLRQLEYFVALARERHFARAAAACYVSQPALSEAIRKLEHELDVPLVNRTHTFQGLTPEGERLVVWARRILADHEALQQEATAMRTGLSGRLRLGVASTASTTAALLLTPFSATHPLVNVELRTRLSTEEILNQLRSFDLDAGIVHLEGVDAADLTVVPLYTERFVLAANRRLLPEDWTERITWSELTQLPLCMLAPSHGSRRLINELIGRDGLELHPHIETDSVAAIYALVETGPWAGVVPREWIHAFSHSPEIRLTAIEEPSVTSTVNLAISASAPGSPLARALAATAGQLSLDEHFEQAAGPR